MKEMTAQQKYNREYRAKHRTKLLEERAIYRKKNRERLRQKALEYYHKNKKDILQRVQKRYAANPGPIKFRIKQRSHLKRNAIGSHTRAEWEELKKKWNHCCADCGMQEPFTEQQYKQLTEDHVVPLSRGGSNNIENIKPLCQSCNASKGNKM